MCGIAGVLMKERGISPELMAENLARMNAQILHRGPDAGAVQVLKEAGLAHRRLAVIDLNPRSTQPMTLLDTPVWIVFNGEIYNFLELRSELANRGRVFRTESDTEVILHGWCEWGEGIVEKLRGMFAFAIWDPRTHTLFLARDRFGKKPLYYADRPDCLLFASEIKSILEWPNVPRTVDLEVIHDYLTFGYCLGRNSAFEGIRKVPPAHYMVVTAGRQPRLERYWRLASVDHSLPMRSKEELAEELIDRLDDAIRCRMIADVPLGAFLSGGVDSSAVVARMATMSSKPVKTFSVGFEIEGYDETPFAQLVAERYQTEHHRFIMDYSLIEELPKLIWHYGEPYADSSSLVTFALAREIRKHVTVALSGDGGDEIFLGYARYARFAELIKNLRAGQRPTVPYKWLVDEGQSARIRDYYARRVETFREEHKLAGYGSNLADQLLTPSADRFGDSLEEAADGEEMAAAARIEVETYLPDDLLVKADIATMAVALEGRSPFLDHKFADWAAALPQSSKLVERDGALELKGLLKFALERYLPSEVLYRRKQGFSVPVRHWMHNEIKDFMIGILTSRRFRDRGLITPAFVQHMLDRHFSRVEDHGTRLWTLLCLELWFQTFIDRRSTGPLAVDVTRAGTSASRVQAV